MVLRNTSDWAGLLIFLFSAEIEFYAPYSKSNLIFNEELIAIKEALRTAEARTSLDGLPISSGVRATLERLMPIYRKYWWPAHDGRTGNGSRPSGHWLDRHGAALNEAIARVYDVSKPDNPVWVDVSVCAHPNGAYEAGPVTHIVISSTSEAYRGYAALEMLFHERSHAWGSVLARPIFDAAREQGINVPPQLPHAVLLYTAGELTARELKASGIAYKHFAEPRIYTISAGPRARRGWLFIGRPIWTASAQSRKHFQRWLPHLSSRRWTERTYPREYAQHRPSWSAET